MRRSIHLIMALATLAMASPVLACTMAPPLRQEEGESGEAFALRQKQVEAEANKTPEQRELENQVWHWENSEVVFVARIERIKINGTIYPRPQKPRPARGRAGRIAPPVPIEPVSLVYGSGHEAFIRTIRLLKGADNFKASWQWVGGMNSCGGTPDGSLGYIYPGGNVIVFGSWATSIDDKNVTAKYLNLYGLTLDEITKPSLKAAIKGD